MLDSAATERVNEAIQKTIAYQQAAKVAARGRFEQDPVGESVGSEAWRTLFESARKFSAEVYPDVPFPAIGVDEVCLLCQQPLDQLLAIAVTRGLKP